MGSDRKKLIALLEELKLQVSAFKRYLPERIVEKILLSPSSAKVEGEHRLVTVLFADISGFTPLSEELSKTGEKGAEEITEIVNSYFTKMLGIVSNYGGAVDKFMGDAMLVLFGAPVAHEDDPERAVRASLEMQTAMKSFEKTETSRGIFSLQISIGINTGLVVAGNVGSESRMEYTVMGDNVNLASRIEQQAKAGEILVSKSTYEKVNKVFRMRPLKSVKVKGKAELIQMYKVLGIHKRIRDRERERAGVLISTGTEIIGREKEIRRLKELWEKVLSGKGQVVAVVGDTGIGKSRLIHQFKNELLKTDPAHKLCAGWLEGRCPSYDGMVEIYSVIRELLMNFFGISEDIPGRTKIKEKMVDLGLDRYIPFIYYILGIQMRKSILAQLDAKAIRQNIFDAVKECLFAESQHRPIILFLDDLHWVDSSSFELLQYIVRRIGDRRVFILCAYRKSERELVKILAEGAREYYTELPITGLSNTDIEEFAKSILGTLAFPVELKKLIIERSEGNPLYLEELLDSLIESGILKQEFGKCILTSSSSKLNIPDSLEGIVMARLDGLNEKERRVLQTASVIGKRFQYKVLKQIADVPQLDKCILELQNKEILDRKYSSSGVYYVFRNILTQEVAYNSLLIKSKTQLHGRIGYCIEELYKEKLNKVYGELAYHYSHSTEYRKAVFYLDKAGEQVEQLYAGKEALDYYTRAISLLETFGEKEEAINLLTKRGNVHKLFYGNYKAALADYEEAVKLSQTAADSQAEALAFSNIGSVFRSIGEYEKALSYYKKVINILEKIEDKKLLSGLLNKIGVVYDDKGELDKALMYYEKALNTSIEVNETQVTVAALSNIGIVYDNKGDYDNAIKYYNDALSIDRKVGNKRGIAFIFGNIGIVYRNQGKYRKALSYFEKSFKIFDKISDKAAMAESLTNIGNVHYKLERYDKALEYQERAIELKEELGIKWGIANSLDEIGMIYQKLGNFKIAVHYHNRSLEIAREIGAKVIEASALINLGIVQFRLNQRKEAKKLIETGISIAEEIGNKEVIDYGENAIREMKYR